MEDSTPMGQTGGWGKSQTLWNVTIKIQKKILKSNEMGPEKKGLLSGKMIIHNCLYFAKASE